MKELIKDIKFVCSSNEFKNKDIQLERLITDFLKVDRIEQLTLTDVVVPKGALSNLDKAIKKAKPNMDKIKDVDKHLDDIR